VAAVHYTFRHKQHTEYTERDTHNNKKKKKGKCWPCPVFASYTLAFALQLRKMYGKTSVRVVEKFPDIPVVVDKEEKTRELYFHDLYRTIFHSLIQVLRNTKQNFTNGRGTSPQKCK
jgi:hypothetical protein